MTGSCNSCLFETVGSCALKSDLYGTEEAKTLYILDPVKGFEQNPEFALSEDDSEEEELRKLQSMFAMYGETLQVIGQ